MGSNTSSHEVKAAQTRLLVDLVPSISESSQACVAWSLEFNHCRVCLDWMVLTTNITISFLSRIATPRRASNGNWRVAKETFADYGGLEAVISSNGFVLKFSRCS